jgi:hypothetical protein
MAFMIALSALPHTAVLARACRVQQHGQSSNCYFTYCLHFAGATDTFNLMLPNLGTISKILIGHDNHGAGSAWHLASVEVISISSGQSCMFHHNGWLSRSDPPYKTEVELLPVGAAGGDGAPGMCRYSIVVCTSDIRGAGATGGDTSG